VILKVSLFVILGFICTFLLVRAVYAGSADEKITFPNDENGDVLRELQNKSVDFSVPHNIEFFAVFKTEEMADIVAKEYLKDSFPNEKLANIETRSAQSGGMELELVVQMLLTHENITRFETRLAERVSKQNGYLDGWGVLVKP
jgi:hypothetical protein